MKRIIAIIMAAVMLLSLAACGGSDANTEPEKEPAEESAQTDVKAPEKEEKEEFRGKDILFIILKPFIHSKKSKWKK